jgi:RND family efflux transporter MFP subunit
VLSGKRCWRLFAVLLPWLFAGCEQGAVSPPPALAVEVWRVEEAVGTGQQQFLGRVVPADLTRVAFRIEGDISELPVQAGQKVVAGQVIARLDDSIQQQVLADARAQYELSRKQLERAETLFRRGSLTPAQRDELKAGFRLATANLELARAHLSYTVVESPFDGIIAAVDKELFESVTPGETVATGFRSERTDVLIELPDSFPAQIHRASGPAAFNPRAKFAGSPGVHPLRYLKSSMARDPGSQAFQVWLSLAEPGLNFPPGTPATVYLDTARAGFRVDSGLVVPLTALEAGAQADSFKVWRIRDGLAEPVAVSVGRLTRRGALVTGGIAAGDLVATSGLSRLTPGQAVTVQAVEQQVETP